jgi:cardiolipin synthase
LFECYIVDDDETGRAFAEILAQKARSGVAVRVIVDWVGSWQSLSLWDAARDAGVRVRIFNSFNPASPLGLLSRDHRKTIVVDGRVGFVSGLCVSARWLGDPRRHREPWRDTGIELRGPAVASLVRAFANVWSACGEVGPADDLPEPNPDMPAAGPVRLYIIANEPALTGTFRMDLIVASIARRYLWLTDAYFVATTAYVQALRAAALDGVDVRLLVPGVSDIPVLSPLSRSQYRPLLEAGVRVFEWQGTMLHAKTAVADGIWSRVGSTNLNLVSWMANYELDVAIENSDFAATMSRQYEADLTRATEIVLTARNRVRRAGAPNPMADAEFTTRRPSGHAVSGSAGRAAAGALGVGSALSAALTNRRALGPAEAGLLFLMAAVAFGIGFVAALWPRIFAWPLALVAAWLGIAWVLKGIAVRRASAARDDRHTTETGTQGERRPFR